jgi:hypothetical protein
MSTTRRIRSASGERASTIHFNWWTKFHRRPLLGHLHVTPARMGSEEQEEESDLFRLDSRTAGELPQLCAATRYKRGTFDAQANAPRGIDLRPSPE